MQYNPARAWVETCSLLWLGAALELLSSLGLDRMSHPNPLILWGPIDAPTVLLIHGDFFRQLVMRNALTKKKTDRRTSVEPKLIEVVWGQPSAARMNSSTLIDTILYGTNHVCPDAVFTLDRAVSRSFRTRFQGLILRCHHTSRTVSSIVIT